MRHLVATSALVGIILVVLLLPAVAPAGDGGASVYIVDNAFFRKVQRPVVRLPRGTTVTWRWSSHQSHSVLARSGPKRFASSVRNHGTYRHRFDDSGVYRIVCSLHAPGMKMTVIVSGR